MDDQRWKQIVENAKLGDLNTQIQIAQRNTARAIHEMEAAMDHRENMNRIRLAKDRTIMRFGVAALLLGVATAAILTLLIANAFPWSAR